MKKVILYIILIIVLVITGLLVHAGILAEVKIDEKQMGPYHVIYKFHQGGYHKIGEVIDEIYAPLKDKENIATSLCFGHYFDNPFTGSIKFKDMRSHAGVIINNEDIGMISAIVAKYNFQSKIIPEENYLVVELPFRSQFSKMTGPVKVYPKIVKRLKQKGSEMQNLIEIFDKPNSRILYLSPISEH